jgi:hypothetical protein
VDQYYIDMMTELELVPKKPEEDNVVEEKPKKRKYNKNKPIDVKSIDVIKGPVSVEF